MAAAGQAPLLQTEHEDDVECARAHVVQVEHCDTSVVSSLLVAQTRPLERADDLVGCQGAGQLEPPVEVVCELPDGLVRAEVAAYVVVRRRAMGPVRVAEHSHCGGAQADD